MVSLCMINNKQISDDGGRTVVGADQKNPLGVRL
jgi:hypothetical protein